MNLGILSKCGLPLRPMVLPGDIVQEIGLNLEIGRLCPAKSVSVTIAESMQAVERASRF